MIRGPVIRDLISALYHLGQLTLCMQLLRKAIQHATTKKYAKRAQNIEKSHNYKNARSHLNVRAFV